VKVKTKEEVMEYVLAFTQLYREEARYLDRTVHYVERVGLDYVKQQVVDDAEKRKALHERLLYTLQGSKNPWAKENVNKREFEALTV
jgi:nitrite reductase (NADH) large subunit